MSFSLRYKELFSLKTLHLYFLDKGLVKFKSLNPEEQLHQLKDYNLQSVVKIIPTSETWQKINGHNLVLKILNSGFTIWARVAEENSPAPFISLHNDLSFTFILQIKDSRFYNYTDLNLANAGKLYYISNRRLESESNSFPLIDKAGGNFNLDEGFVLSEAGQKSERKFLQAGETGNLLGIIRIFMKGDKGSLHITDADGKLRAAAINFEIVLKNRSTYWRYYFNTSQQITGSDDVRKENGNSKILITKEPYPLTQNGFMSVELNKTKLPNPGIAIIKPDAGSNKIFSEVYM